MLTKIFDIINRSPQGQDFTFHSRPMLGGMEHKLPLTLLGFDVFGIGDLIFFEPHEDSFGRIPKLLVGQDARDILKNFRWKGVG